MIAALAWLVAIPLFIGLWIWLDPWVIWLIIAAVVGTASYISRGRTASTDEHASDDLPRVQDRAFLREGDPSQALDFLWRTERRGRPPTDGSDPPDR